MADASRQGTLAQLATHLLQAAKTQNWDALEAADQQLAAQLPPLAAQGAWSAAERLALQGLRQAHEVAQNAAFAAGESLAERLTQLQSGRDGWIAYALHSEHDSEGRRP